jgi:RNA polymerase sigma-70 factor (ECF subfamily)
MDENTRGAGAAGNFEQVVMPHLDAAYNLARWLVRNPQDAEDVVQEAYLRALKFFGGYQGGDARAWVLAIVRNTSYSFMEKNRHADGMEEFDEELHTVEAEQLPAETALMQSIDAATLRAAMEELPVNFREVLVLRELEGMSYKQIAEVTGAPVGTVMSGLARSRARLRKKLLANRAREDQRGL